MKTILTLNPAITDTDEQFDALIAQFEAADEALSDKVYSGTDAEIDAHEPMCDYCDEYHTQYGDNWGRLKGAEQFYIQTGECLCLVIEQLPDEAGIGQVWYTDNWEDMEEFAQQF